MWTDFNIFILEYLYTFLTNNELHMSNPTHKYTSIYIISGSYIAKSHTQCTCNGNTSYCIFYPISGPHIARSNTCNGFNQYFNLLTNLTPYSINNTHIHVYSLYNKYHLLCTCIITHHGKIIYNYIYTCTCI